MNERPIPSPFIVPPSGGKVLSAFGDEITVHLGAAETGGKYTMFTDVTPPGGGPPPHYHLTEDAMVFVLEGRAEFFMDNFWTEVPAGSTVFMPRGVAHAFRNPGDKPLRQLTQMAPSGFDFFSPAAQRNLPNPARPTWLASWTCPLSTEFTTLKLNKPFAVVGFGSAFVVDRFGGAAQLLSLGITTFYVTRTTHIHSGIAGSKS